MKKTIAAILLGAMMFCGNAFAMQFEHPKYLGGVDIADIPSTYFEVHDATYLDAEKLDLNKVISANAQKAKYYERALKRQKNLYVKGSARFGDGEDSLWMHCNTHLYENLTNNASRTTARPTLFRLGGMDINNTVPVHPYYTTIKLIKSNSPLTLYLLSPAGQTGPSGITWVLIGKQSDGKFVTFFNSDEIRKKYFGEGNTKKIHFDKCKAEKDSIVLYYYNPQIPHPSGDPRKRNLLGEFRFKWDEDAQWFGVEQIVY